MAMEAKAQVKVGVNAKKLWKAMAKDYTEVIPKIMPGLVDKIEITEGNGGVGSVLFFHLGSRARTMKTQREKIVEVEEATYKFGLEVVEGIILRKGYSSFKTSFKLTPEGDEETLVDVRVVFELHADGEGVGHGGGEDDRLVQLKKKATEPAVGFLLGLEKYILENSD